HRDPRRDHRRPVRDHLAVRDHPGHELQGDGQARLPDGAAAAPLRAQGLERGHHRGALLDRRRDPRRHRPGDLLPRRPAEAHLMTSRQPTVPVLERAWPDLDVGGLRILVTGFGVSGFAIADQTMQRGAHVLVVDGADSPEIRERAQILEVLGVEFRLGAEHTRALPQDREIDLVVTSPGWRPDQPLLRAAADAGIPVWSEIELARRMQAADGPAWLGITGTNGKTTTVTMLESILQHAGLRAVACGNVGL